MQQSLTRTGPAPADFAGDSKARAAKRLFHATRPRFFPASILPVLVGSAWGFAVAGRFDAVVFALALIATVLVHAGANVLNDVGDEIGGSDRGNEDRIYPYTGGSRFIQAGIMDLRQMRRLGIGLLALAVLPGLGLLLIKGPAILLFGLVGIALAVTYSLSPLQLASRGVGEAAVAVGFGVLPVSGAAWLQSGSIDVSVGLFSVPVSLWVAAILLINEVPDIAADGAAGKRTLAVRLRRRGTAVLYAALHLGALAAFALLVIQRGAHWWTLLVPVALAIMALAAAREIGRGADFKRPIEATLGIHTIGSIWLIAVVLSGALS